MKTYHPPPSDLKGNYLKNFVQEDFGQKLLIEKQMVLEAATGFGKTKSAIQAITKVKSKNTLVIVPTITLQTQWKNQVDCDVRVINGFVFHPEDKKKYDFVIFDEGHRILNKDSEWFSTALDIVEPEYLLILSATLSKEHYKFLLAKRPEIAVYKISLSWCFRYGLIPKHVNINIPVSLTIKEKSDIIKMQTQYDKYARWFATYKIFHPYIDYAELDNLDSEMEKGQLIGMINKWRKSTNDRKMILQNASNKLYILTDFLNKVREEKPQKCLIFGKSIKMIEQAVEENEGAVCYHSNCKEKEKKECFSKFFSGESPFLISINTIIEGFDMESFATALGFESSVVQLALRLAYDSNELKTIQALGRTLRYNENNPEQQVIMVNLYVEDFDIRGKKYKSQEKIWLINNLQSQINVMWLNNVDEIVL